MLRLVIIDLVPLVKALTSFFFYKEATGFKVKSLTGALSLFVI